MCVSTCTNRLRSLAVHGLFVLFVVGAAPSFSERLTTQLQQSFAACDGASVARVGAAITLSVPKRCEFSDGRALSGVVDFEVTEPAQADAPLRTGGRLIVTAKALVFDSQQFDGVLLEGVLGENDSVTLTSPKRRAKVKVKPAPPKAGVHRVETPPRQVDPIGDAVRDVGRVLGALPVLVPSAMRHVSGGVDAAAFALEPALVALWLFAAPAGADAG